MFNSISKMINSTVSSNIPDGKAIAKRIIAYNEFQKNSSIRINDVTNTKLFYRDLVDSIIETQNDLLYADTIEIKTECCMRLVRLLGNFIKAQDKINSDLLNKIVITAFRLEKPAQYAAFHGSESDKAEVRAAFQLLLDIMIEKREYPNNIKHMIDVVNSLSK